jgi:hypothetical protein
METPVTRLSPEMRSSLQRHFPTLLVALPRAARSLLRGVFAVANRLRQRITRRRVIAIAVAGLVLGSTLEGRRTRFSRLADYHNSQVVGVTLAIVMTAPRRVCVTQWYDNRGIVVSPQQVLKDEWHRMLATKYRRAAARPWHPVGPDPPPPAA